MLALFRAGDGPLAAPRWFLKALRATIRNCAVQVFFHDIAFSTISVAPFFLTSGPLLVCAAWHPESAVDSPPGRTPDAPLTWWRPLTALTVIPNELSIFIHVDFPRPWSIEGIAYPSRELGIQFYVHPCLGGGPGEVAAQRCKYHEEWPGEYESVP